MGIVWLRRAVWFTVIAGWLAVVLYFLLNAAPAGRVVACCIFAVLTWVGVHMGFTGWLGILKHVKPHLGEHPRRCQLLDHSLSPRQRLDVVRTLQELFPGQHQVFGMTSSYQNLQDQLNSNPEPEKPDWESYKSGVAEWTELPSNACWLAQFDGHHCVVRVSEESSYRYHDAFDDDPAEHRNTSRYLLSIVARDRKACSEARDAIIRQAAQYSVFRGKSLLVRSGENRRDPVVVEFTDLPSVKREQIILPEQIFDVVQRVAMQQVSSGRVLEQAGHRTRTAILLHGPPGTGKTLMTQYLVGLQTEATTILLHGFRRGLVREAFVLARYCQPSVIVLEDVDLIAVRRQRNRRGTTALHELMDELDGLAPESRTVVIMTTNRPDVLEPALASRPGRVSQALEVPLPDADCRRRILELFTARVNVSGEVLDDWTTRTDGASPAFLEELVRRTILFASERGVSEGQSIDLTATDFSEACTEIIGSGGILTRRLLGYTEDPESGKS